MLNLSANCDVFPLGYTAGEPFTVSGPRPDTAREVAIRIRSACAMLDLRPTGRIILPTQGAVAHLDLAAALLALGYDRDDVVYIGELSLAGAVRGVRGLLPLLRALPPSVPRVVIPASQALEVAPYLYGLPADVAVVPCASLSEALRIAEGVPVLPLTPEPLREPEGPSAGDLSPEPRSVLDRIVERAPAGSLLIGPPGSGRVMIARRVGGAMPPLSCEERLEVATTMSRFGLPYPGGRPFRAPHHTASAVGLAQEVALAEYGMILLDEVCEFSRPALRAFADAYQAREGARRPVLIASTNPCPCGRQGSACRCSPAVVEAYFKRLEPLQGLLEHEYILPPAQRAQ